MTWGRAGGKKIVRLQNCSLKKNSSGDNRVMRMTEKVKTKT